MSPSSRLTQRTAPVRTTSFVVTLLTWASALVMLLVGCGPGADGATQNELTVVDAAVDVPANPSLAAVRLVIRNDTAEADALVAVSSPDGRASVHRTDDADGRAVMVAVDRLPVPARSSVVFEPGGLHVMIDDIGRDLAVGDTVTVEMTFERAGVLTVEVPVVEPGEGTGDHDHEAQAAVTTPAAWS